MILEMMLVLRYKWTLWASQQLLHFNMTSAVLPKIEFRYGHVVALLATKRFYLSLGIYARNAKTRLIHLLEFELRSLAVRRRGAILILLYRHSLVIRLFQVFGIIVFARVVNRKMLAKLQSEITLQKIAINIFHQFFNPPSTVIILFLPTDYSRYTSKQDKRAVSARSQIPRLSSLS